jgi:Tol biopolymer transport system component
MIEIKTVDDPESPDFSPDGKKVVFAGLQGAVGDLFVLDLDTKQITNITKDNFADSGPTWSPDGKYIVYVARVSGQRKAVQGGSSHRNEDAADVRDARRRRRAVCRR